MEINGISKLDLKRRNRMQILRLLQQVGATSRIDLSIALDLTRAAVTILTGEMIEQGILLEKGEFSPVGQKASRGRKKVLIDLDRNCKFAFGIALERKKVWIGLSNIGGETLEKRVLELSPNTDRESALQQIATEMEQMLQNNCLRTDRLVGIGLCYGDWASRFFELRTEDDRIDTTGLEQWLTTRFELPVVCDTLINGAAIAENDLFYASVSGAPMVLVRFEDQIEAAMLVEGELYRGAHKRAMDLAHMIVRPQGRPCTCGKQGCLVAECSLESVYVDLVNIFSPEHTPKLYARMDGNANLLRVAELAEYEALGDEAVTAVFDDRVNCMVTFLNNLIAAIDPGRILLIGSWFQGEQGRDRLRRLVAEQQTDPLVCQIEIGNLSYEQVYLSGCALAIRRFFIERGGISKEKENDNQ